MPERDGAPLLGDVEERVGKPLAMTSPIAFDITQRMPVTTPASRGPPLRTEISGPKLTNAQRP